MLRILDYECFCKVMNVYVSGFYRQIYPEAVNECRKRLELLEINDKEKYTLWFEGWKNHV